MNYVYKVPFLVSDNIYRDTQRRMIDERFVMKRLRTRTESISTFGLLE